MESSALADAVRRASCVRTAVWLNVLPMFDLNGGLSIGGPGRFCKEAAASNIECGEESVCCMTCRRMS